MAKSYNVTAEMVGPDYNLKLVEFMDLPPIENRAVVEQNPQATFFFPYYTEDTRRPRSRYNPEALNKQMNRLLQTKQTIGRSKIYNNTTFSTYLNPIVNIGKSNLANR